MPGTFAVLARKPLPDLHIDAQAYSRVREFLRSKNTFLQRLKRRLHGMLSQPALRST